MAHPAHSAPRRRGARVARRAPYLVLLAAGVLVLAAWGDVGHRLSGEAAARSLPPSMPAFFRDSWRELGYLNPEPDRWKDRAERNADPALEGATSPDHFVDTEMVPPDVYAAALRAPNRFAYADTLAKAGVKASVFGFLPFRILELSQRLRVDFRNWRAAPDSVKPWIEQRIIDDAGLLGHYVADGSNPAHTSDQYNGWTRANPNGYATDKQFHARFESTYVGAHIKLDDVLAKMDTNAHVVPDFRAAIVAYLRESNAQIEPLYQLDKAHPFNAATTAPENLAFTTDRLAAGARMLRDLWWTAWVTSANTK
jgi:hypothetical protein